MTRPFSSQVCLPACSVCSAEALSAVSFQGQSRDFSWWIAPSCLPWGCKTTPEIDIKSAIKPCNGQLIY